MKKLNITVENVDGGCLLKDYLRACGYTVTFIKKVKLSGIELCGVPVTVRAVVKNGDVITLMLPEEKSEGIPPISIPLDVLYEDEYILAVDKPRNMPTHPSKGNSLPTLANAVMALYGGDFVFRAVSRLDRDTSGIVVIAKDQITAAALSEQMKRGEFDKRYTCITEGIPSPAAGTINAPIRREQEDGIKRIVAEDGKSAVTEYEVIKSDAGRSLCRLRLLTGRTHQIRVHMAHIGCPLHGDFLYGTATEDGYFLRCDSVSFTHPKSGERITVKTKETLDL